MYSKPHSGSLPPLKRALNLQEKRHFKISHPAVKFSPDKQGKISAPVEIRRLI